MPDTLKYSTTTALELLCMSTVSPEAEGNNKYRALDRVGSMLATQRYIIKQ